MCKIHLMKNRKVKYKTYSVKNKSLKLKFFIFFNEIDFSLNIFLIYLIVWFCLTVSKLV